MDMGDGVKVKMTLDLDELTAQLHSFGVSDADVLPLCYIKNIKQSGLRPHRYLRWFGSQQHDQQDSHQLCRRSPRGLCEHQGRIQGYGHHHDRQERPARRGRSQGHCKDHRRRPRPSPPPWMSRASSRRPAPPSRSAFRPTCRATLTWSSILSRFIPRANNERS